MAEIKRAAQLDNTLEDTKYFTEISEAQLPSGAALGYGRGGGGGGGALAVVDWHPLVGRGVVEGVCLSRLRSRRLHCQVSVKSLPVGGDGDGKLASGDRKNRTGTPLRSMRRNISSRVVKKSWP